MTPTPAHPLDGQQLLEAIAEAQASYISHVDIREIFDGLLMHLLRLTGSEYGFIGEVLRTPEGAPFMRTQAISNVAWDDRTRAFFEANAPSGLEFHNLGTLFGHVLRTGEVVVANDPAHDPRAGGLPDGHPRLEAYLGLPFFADGELVGAAGISNRAGGYDEDVVRFLEPFMATCGNLLLANRAKRSQEEIARLKREFVAVASHELRTPMTSIRGALGLLHGPLCVELSPTVAELVRVAYESSERMRRLLDDLLDVEKLDSGGVRLDLGQCDLDEVIRESAERQRPRADTAGVRVELGPPREVPIWGDRGRLLQVMEHLLSNAIKASHPGGVVRLRCRDHGDSLRVEVSDQGRGIPGEALQSVFEKFRQVGDLDTRREDGVGLGLYIVKGLVEQHAGRVHVSSELGVGTTFTLIFPRRWTHAEGAPREAPA
ncbi:MAG: GAF domain-containing sensor histidine kinase [Alphaproteobacteria bacterium]|nr:GAF domain-containing sensor histidine kinase [Alphaproteobacteria bacterium]MCB9796085.1 GAF domain-containing sensor histidine kinase [Alphaproteobacteria bacterium]